MWLYLCHHAWLCLTGLVNWLVVWMPLILLIPLLQLIRWRRDSGRLLTVANCERSVPPALAGARGELALHHVSLLGLVYTGAQSRVFSLEWFGSQVSGLVGCCLLFMDSNRNLEHSSSHSVHSLHEIVACINIWLLKRCLCCRGYNFLLSVS